MTPLVIGLIAGFLAFIILYWVTDFDEFWPSVLVSIVTTVLITLLALSIQNDNRLFKQCVEDGHKEYECVSMLHGNFQDR